MEFEPDKVVPALTEFKNKRPKVWQDILKRIKGMFTAPESRPDPRWSRAATALQVGETLDRL